MAILSPGHVASGMALLIASLVAAGACTNFEVADTEVQNASDAAQEADADVSADAGSPDASNRIESTMREVHLAIPDPDADGIKDIAPIAAGCIILSAEVDIDVRHPWRGDIVVNLTSPAGTLVLLKSYVDADQADDIVGTFPTTIVPTQPLTILAGEEGMGSWTMAVADLDSGDMGTFETWGLRLACQ